MDWIKWASTNAVPIICAIISAGCVLWTSKKTRELTNRIENQKIDIERTKQDFAKEMERAKLNFEQGKLAENIEMERQKQRMEIYKSLYAEKLAVVRTLTNLISQLYVTSREYIASTAVRRHELDYDLRRHIQECATHATTHRWLFDDGVFFRTHKLKDTCSDLQIYVLGHPEEGYHDDFNHTPVAIEFRHALDNDFESVSEGIRAYMNNREIEAFDSLSNTALIQ